MDSMHHLVQREVESREIQAKTNKSLIDSPIRGQQTTASNRPFQKKRTVSITHVGDSL